MWNFWEWCLQLLILAIYAWPLSGLSSTWSFPIIGRSLHCGIGTTGSEESKRKRIGTNELKPKTF